MINTIRRCPPNPIMQKCKLLHQMDNMATLGCLLLSRSIKSWIMPSLAPMLSFRPTSRAHWSLSVMVSRLVWYTVMAWDLGMHLVTSSRCLRNLTMSLISWLVTVYLLDHMTLLSCDALCLETASASLWGIWPWDWITYKEQTTFTIW